jgi:hypothetical protein
VGPEQFLAAFDRDHWLTMEEVIERLDKAGYWEPCWPLPSPAQKVSYVKAAGRALKAVDDTSMIAWREREAESGGFEYVFKPTDTLTLDDYRELYGYLLAGLKSLRHRQDRYPEIEAEVGRQEMTQFEDEDAIPF